MKYNKYMILGVLLGCVLGPVSGMRPPQNFSGIKRGPLVKPSMRSGIKTKFINFFNRFSGRPAGSTPNIKSQPVKQKPGKEPVTRSDQNAQLKTPFWKKRNSQHDLEQPKKSYWSSAIAAVAAIAAGLWLKEESKVAVEEPPVEVSLTEEVKDPKDEVPAEAEPLVLSKKSIHDPEYSINLMWINKENDQNQEYLWPADRHETIFKHITDWATKNSSGVVNFWYDSAMLSAEAVQKTEQLIREFQGRTPGVAPIHLQDVRDLDIVKKNSAVFGPETPVYFRADLLRVIAAYEKLSSKSGRDGLSSFVYADCDMEAMSKEELFSDETKANLHKYGIVMERGGYRGFENAFMMVSNSNDNLLDSINRCVINLNLKRAKNALKGDFYTVNGRQSRTPTNELTQIVYDSWAEMFKYFYAKEGYGDLIKGSDQIYKDSEGLKPFGLNQLKSLEIRVYDEFFKELPHDEYSSVEPPTKDVKAYMPRHKGGDYD